MLTAKVAKTKSKANIAIASMMDRAITAVFVVQQTFLRFWSFGKIGLSEIYEQFLINIQLVSSSSHNAKCLVIDVRGATRV